MKSDRVLAWYGLGSGDTEIVRRGEEKGRGRGLGKWVQFSGHPIALALLRTAKPLFQKQELGINRTQQNHIITGGLLSTQSCQLSHLSRPRALAFLLQLATLGRPLPYLSIFLANFNRLPPLSSIFQVPPRPRSPNTMH